MIILILVFSVFFILSGAAFILNPAGSAALLQRNAERVELQLAAVAVRLVLGWALVVSAGESRFPGVIHVLGWIAIVAAVLLAVIGRRKFVRLMNWALTLVEPFGRVAGVIAIVFGGFLIYAYN